MSSFTLFGLFPLSGGRSVSRPKPKDSNATYRFFLYRSTIQCVSGAEIPAEVSIFPEPGQQPLPDNTVAFLLARAYIPDSGDAILDVIHMYPFPGDPTSDHYEDNIPDILHPYAVAVGHVSGNGIVLADGQSKSFPISASQYVRDGPRASTLRSVFSFYIYYPHFHYYLFLQLYLHTITSRETYYCSQLWFCSPSCRCMFGPYH